MAFLVVVKYWLNIFWPRCHIVRVIFRFFQAVFGIKCMVFALSIIKTLIISRLSELFISKSAFETEINKLNWPSRPRVRRPKHAFFRGNNHSHPRTEWRDRRWRARLWWQGDGWNGHRARWTPRCLRIAQGPGWAIRPCGYRDGSWLIHQEQVRGIDQKFDEI